MINGVIIEIKKQNNMDVSIEIFKNKFQLG